MIPAALDADSSPPSRHARRRPGIHDFAGSPYVSTFGPWYEFLGEPWFQHDFDSVESEADSFDLALGTPGLHRVRRKVEWLERPSVLPPELFNRFVNDAFWRVAENDIRGVPMIVWQE